MLKFIIKLNLNKIYEFCKYLFIYFTLNPFSTVYASIINVKKKNEIGKDEKGDRKIWQMLKYSK